MNNGPSKAVLVFAAVALLVAGAFAQSAEAGDRAQIDRLFEQATSYWQQGRYDDAANALKQLLAEDPSQEDAYDLLRKVENQMLLDMVTRGGDSEKVVKLLLERAHLGEMEHTKDEAAIKDLVDKAVHGADMSIRENAVRTLVAQHGEYAVPYLYHYLGSNDRNERVYAILALSELSTDAVLPLVEVLGSDNWMIRKNAAYILEKIGDMRAIGGLAALAATAENAEVKAAATQASAALAASMEMEAVSAVDAYLWLAKKYYMRDADVIRNYLSGYTLWSWEEGRLADRDVPRYLYHLELAEEAAYDALMVAGENQDVRNMLAAIQYAEYGALNALTDDAKASDEVQALMDHYWNVIPLTHAQGLDTQLGALSLGLEWNDPWVSRQALAAIPVLWDRRELTAELPLVAALDAEDKTVRFAAAVALLEIDPAAEFPGAGKVIPLAAQAADTGSLRQVLLIEPDAATRAKALQALDAAGVFAVAESSGMAGYIRAKEVGTFDVIVMRYTLDDELALKLVRELRRDFRTAGIPILISGGDAEISEAKEMFGTAVQGYTAADPLDIDAVKTAASQSMNDDQKMALMVSRTACDALAGFTTAHTAYGNFAMAEGALLNVLASDKPDDIRIAALGALGNVGSAKAIGALVDTFGKTANSTSVRVAAAGALGDILLGKAAPANVFDALLAGVGDEASEVRGAAGAALGAMMLTSAQENRVLTEHRVK